jgi:hypothetical protein
MEMHAGAQREARCEVGKGEVDGEKQRARSLKREQGPSELGKPSANLPSTIFRSQRVCAGRPCPPQTGNSPTRSTRRAAPFSRASRCQR